MQKIRGLLTSSTFFMLVTLIEASAPFLLAPVLTRYLSLYDYGLWAIFQSTTALLKPIVGLSLDDYIRIHYHRNDRKFIVQVMLAACAVSLIIAMLLLLSTLVLRTQVNALLLFPKGQLWTIILCGWLYSTFYLVLTYHQFADNKLAYTLTQLAQAIVAIAFTVLLIVSGSGWLGAVSGKIIGLASGCMIGAFYIGKDFSWKEAKLHFNHFPLLCSFAVRYLPCTVLPISLIAIDRIMLAHMAGMDAASLYAVASLFPSMLLIAVQGFLRAWQPWCFSRLTQNPVPWHDIGLGALFFVVMLPLGAVILYDMTLIVGPLIVGKSFQLAFEYVFMLILGGLAQGYYIFSQSILQYYQKIATLSLLACGMAVSKVVLNLVFLPLYGVNGVGLSTFVTYMGASFVAAAIAWGLMRKRMAA